MNVAAVQFKGRRDDFDSSLRRLVALATHAADGADLVVLPELAATQYLFDDASEARAHAEPADGPTFAALSPVAAQAGCWVVAGFPELDGDALYNSALVIDPQGDLAFVYRKTLLYPADESWACPGDSGYRAFDTGAGRFTVGICMDLNDDGFVDWCANADVRVVALATNWLESDDDLDTWVYWAWRMQGLDAALVTANTYGPERDIVFCGRSCVLDERVVYAAADVTGDAVIRAALPASSSADRLSPP